MYRTGDIVCVSYGDFKGEKRVGLFLILYNERQDRNYSSRHSNIICAKLTTNNFQGDSHVIKINSGNFGMKNDTLINLSKLHTFTLDRVYRKVGTVSGLVMAHVFKELNKLQAEMNAQLMELF